MQVERIKNQKGFVLILTMVMLAVLSILGVMVLNSTDTELSITTNYRQSSEAFTAAELVMAYAQDRILDNRSSIDLSEDNNLDQILGGIAGIDLVSGGINEVDAYNSGFPRRLAGRFSVDMTGRGNVFRTTPTGSGGVMPYYRTTIETSSRGRSVARLESVQVDLTGGF